MDLTSLLTDLAKQHNVPGASVAVLHQDTVSTAATGVLNVATGVEVTPDSLFQIGSISKVYTATVVMQLVAEGKFHLDDPVTSVLPAFEAADREASRSVTFRQLLCHSSGIDGDHFHDTGRGDECLERYVDSMRGLTQVHPPGATMSYCNAGYSLLGRVIEVVTGTQWDAAMRERLFAPLGLTHTVTLPEEALRYRTAIGHLGKPGEPLEPAPVWGLMRSCGPAGLINSTAFEVLAFAQAHLEGGGALLAAGETTAMQQPQVAVPDRWTLGDHWGLGWILFEWDGQAVYGHDGNTIGQSAFLRIVPSAGVAIALLTNGGAAADLYQDLYRAVLAETADLAMPPRPEPLAGVAVDPTPYVGTYSRAAATIDVSAEDDGLRATITNTSPLARMLPDPVQRFKLQVSDPANHLFVTKPKGTETWVPMVFFALDGGDRYVHFGARATPLRPAGG